MGTAPFRRAAPCKQRSQAKANRSYDGDDHRDNEPSYDDDDRGRSGRSHDRDVYEDDDDRGPMEFFSPRPPYIKRLLSGEPLRPPAGAGQKGPFASRSGTTVTTQWYVAARLQRRVQPLPGVCTARLPRLRPDWVRVVLAAGLFCSTRRSGLLIFSG